MFVHPIHPDPTTSYWTPASASDVATSLILATPSPVPVLVLSSSPGSTLSPFSDEEVDCALSGSTPQLIPLSIHQYRQHAPSFACTHVLVQSHSLFSALGYRLADLDRSVIFVEQTTPVKVEKSSEADNKPEKDKENVDHNSTTHTTLPRLELCRLHIPVRRDDSYTILFILSRLQPVTVLVSDGHEAIRIKMLARLFRMNTLTVIKSPSDIPSGGVNCLVWWMQPGTVPAGTADMQFLVSERGARGFARQRVDPRLAGKYKYRIGDMARRLSRRVVEKHEEFDYELYSRVAE